MIQLPPNIRQSGVKHFVGMRHKLSFSNNSTNALWKTFTPLRSQIKRTIGPDLYSIDIYPDGFFDAFDLNKQFERWAAVQVAAPAEVPQNMDTLILEDGLYAEFYYKGKPSQSPAFFDWIFSTWLPNSPYLVDNRPHLAVMGTNYLGENDASEEQIWIPIKPASKAQV